VGHVHREPERRVRDRRRDRRGARAGVPAEARTIVDTGFLGAYTAFCTDTYEIVRRGDDGQPRVAAVYALASLVLAGALTAAGLVVTGAL
jgi:fluoride ion exporter CrcB/FEX